MTLPAKTLSRSDFEPSQRWQRARAIWDTLGYHARVYYTQAHIQDEAKKAGKQISGGEAWQLARLAVDEENAQILLPGVKNV